MMPRTLTPPFATAFALLLAGWAVARLALGYGRGEAALRHLSSHEQAVVRAAGDAIFPPGGALPISGTDAGVVAHVDRYVGALSTRSRVLIRLLLFLVEHATLVFAAPGWDGIRRFSKLSLAQRTAVLEDWSRSRLALRRTVFQSLRAVLSMAYFSDPAVLRAIGLAPLAIESPVVDADLLYPPIGQPKSAIRATLADRDRTVLRAPLDPHGPLDPAYRETA
jgi:hypothetical protein